MNQETVKDKILAAINSKEFYLKMFPEWDGNNATLIKCPRASTHHEGGNDSSPSFSLNGDTGEYNCFGCGLHGTSVIGLVTDIKFAGNFKKALAVLYNKYVGAIVTKDEIARYHRTLLKNASIIRALAIKRRWSKETIERYQLGWNPESKRVTIPIFTAIGFATDLREHDSINKAPLVDGKRIPVKARKGSVNGSFFPMNTNINPFSVDELDIWILEGEPDTILARQEGINAVTLTGGVNHWLKIPDDMLRLFQYRNIIICLDNDKPGQEVARKLAARFVGMEIASLKIVTVPEGKDFSDFVIKHGGSGDLLKQISRVEEYVIKPRNKTAHVLPLSATSEARYMGMVVVSDVIVNGKHKAPYVIPRKLQFSCNTSDRCAKCPCDNPLGVGEHYVNPSDSDVLEWIKKEPKNKIKSDYGLSAKCPISVEVVDYQNLEAVSLIPALSLSADKDKDLFCQRAGFYVGHGIEANKAYRIKGIPTRMPNNNEAAIIIEQIDSGSNSVEGFTLPKEKIEHLKQLMTDEPLKILEDISDMLSANHTKIYDRRALHIAVDLTYHSPKEFSFAGVNVPKGSMELLLFGDTRCGKGQVAEGMARFYDLGAVVSGESSSFMGLFGGVVRVGDSFQLTWGAIPLNNGRLVIIDEFSGLASADMGKLSRVRSEGIAEMNKGGIAAKTRANTRLIWIANPRGGKQVASFGSGAQAIMDLIRAAEDVARFDLAIVVQKDEVDTEVINKPHSTIESRYGQHDLRSILLWGWSRQKDHIIFTKEATAYILSASNTLSKRYTSTIPLIQGENIRFKLAKIAAAVAIRCFSTDDGIFVKVEQKHAKAAVTFLVACYDKPSMGYKLVSTIEHKASSLVNVTMLDRWFEQFEATRRAIIIDSMLEASAITVRDIEDATDHDNGRCKKHLGFLVRSHALRPAKRGEYEKRPAFINYLKKKREESNE